jgi:transcriptional regulator with XRE-family HTH domain
VLKQHEKGDKMDQGTKIKTLRTAKGLRQDEVAALAGIRKEYVSYVESGQTEEWERKLLAALGYEPSMDDTLMKIAGTPA